MKNRQPSIVLETWVWIAQVSCSLISKKLSRLWTALAFTSMKTSATTFACHLLKLHSAYLNYTQVKQILTKDISGKQEFQFNKSYQLRSKNSFQWFCTLNSLDSLPMNRTKKSLKKLLNAAATLLTRWDQLVFLSMLNSWCQQLRPFWTKKHSVNPRVVKRMTRKKKKNKTVRKTRKTSITMKSFLETRPTLSWALQRRTEIASCPTSRNLVQSSISISEMITLSRTRLW